MGEGLRKKSPKRHSHNVGFSRATTSNVPTMTADEKILLSHFARELEAIWTGQTVRLIGHVFTSLRHQPRSGGGSRRCESRWPPDCERRAGPRHRKARGRRLRCAPTPPCCR